MEGQTKPRAIPTQDIERTIQEYIFRLRLKFLLPGILMIILALIFLISTIYFHESNSIDEDLVQLQSTTSDLYKNSISQNAKALQTIMDGLSTNRELATALSNQDRQLLLQHSASIYENFNHHYGITHFYFSNPERVNILRVHKPEKHGDIIDRQTTLLAYQDGKDHYGVELGVMGSLTLRYVRPWHDEQTHKLLGFVELGMEVDNSVDAIRDLLGLEVYTLINKRHLEKSSWEEGAEIFGYKTGWEEFPQVVIGMDNRKSLPNTLSTLIQKTAFNSPEPHLVSKVRINGQCAVFIPLNSMSGHHIGELIIIKDISSTLEHSQKLVLISSGVLLSGSVIAVIFFYWLVGRVAKRMANNEIALQQLATHDCLTGLLNRQQFDLTLESAITQFSRYGRSVSLLMIDIDHFKQVNDNYGHPAGDSILVEIGKHLTEQARAIDSVYRYGGEEFSILLPETNSPQKRW